MAAVFSARRWRGIGCALGLGLASPLALPPSNATAVGLMAEGSSRAVEQRFALASAPGRVALWSQVRLSGEAGDVAIVLPVADGTALDWGSRAFFESLEVATAPRIVPPDGAPAVCPGDEPEPLAHVAGDAAGSATLEPAETALLDDAAAVQAWADARGLDVSPGLSVALQTAGSVRFFVARFAAPSGTSLTKALRVVTPGGTPAFPLVLTQAQRDPVDVVLWSVGNGRASVDGTAVALDTSDLVFDVGNVSSNYGASLATALGSEGSLVYQMSSHEALRDTIQAQDGGPPIESVIRTYFERASAFGETTGDPMTCTTAAAVVLGQDARVGTTCPRTTLGVAGGGAACAADVIDAGEVDPALLRCGTLSDDLAVLLSDQVAGDAWLTRVAARIPAGGVGEQRDVDFPGGQRTDPSVYAVSIDLSSCDGGQGGMSSSTTSTGSGPGGPSGSGPTGGNVTVVEVPVYAYDGCACDGEFVIVDYESVPEDDAPDGYYVDEGDGCSSDTADTYTDDDYSSSAPDDCGGETYDGSDSYYDDGCGCDDGGGADDFDADGCSCDAGDSGGSVDSCDCGEGIDATDSGCGGEDCAVKPQRKGKARRPNKVAYGILGVVILVRRMTRKKKKAGEKKKG